MYPDRPGFGLKATSGSQEGPREADFELAARRGAEVERDHGVCRAGEAKAAVGRVPLGVPGHVDAALRADVEAGYLIGSSAHAHERGRLGRAERVLDAAEDPDGPGRAGG